MKYERIVVTGGSGMVGRSLKDIMPNAIYLSSKDCDLRNKDSIDKMLPTYNPEVIVHLAAKVGGILDNMNKPAEYFIDNVLMNTLLMESAYHFGVKRFISTLSTCIYPDIVEEYPMKESELHAGPPTPTNFSYAYAKRCLAVQTDAYNKQYDLKYQYLIPCNLYGEYDKYGENSHFVAALLAKILKAKDNKDSHITLFGTGNPLRQFMHSSDLAKVIKICIEEDIYDHMNIASKEVLTINQIAEIAINACNASNLSIKYNSSFPDGQFRKDVSTQLLDQKISSFKSISLYDGIKKTYEIIK